MKLEFSRHIFEKCSNIKYHENPSSGSRVVKSPWKDGRTDMTKLIIPFSQLCDGASKCCRGTHTARGLDTPDVENRREYLACQEK